MTVSLFIDPGTACGFAVGSMGADGKPHILVSGDWDLRITRFETWAMKGIKFRRKLEELYKVCPFTVVGVEEVRRHLGTDAAHQYGAYLFVLQEFCLEKGIPLEAVPVGTLKKFWTGAGNASKEMMMRVARAMGFEPATDNEADAIAGWHWLQAQSGTSSDLDRAVEPIAAGPSVSDQNSSQSKINSEAAE